ncbi:MAG: type 1 glutamine amidotransferase domain-containing protein [Desulfofustis sp.]|jgi:putative intracellular protease/amidase
MSTIRIALVIVALIVATSYWTIPVALRQLGLHQHYDIPAFDLASKRALVVTTSHGVLGETGKVTGVFGSELTVPYYAFVDAGLEVNIASIKGGAIPVEPRSMSWPLATDDDYRFRKDAVAMGKLMNSMAVSDVQADEYDVIYMAGGWGAAYDLAQSQELAELVSAANAQGAILGAICHGVLGLVSAKDVDGTPLMEGRRATGVTDKQVKELNIDITPKHPETELRAVGADFEANTGFRDFFATHVVVDANIVTGQNQNSGYETSHRILELLAAK